MTALTPRAFRSLIRTVLWLAVASQVPSGAIATAIVTATTAAPSPASGDGLVVPAGPGDRPGACAARQPRLRAAVAVRLYAAGRRRPTCWPAPRPLPGAGQRRGRARRAAPAGSPRSSSRMAPAANLIRG